MVLLKSPVIENGGNLNAADTGDEFYQIISPNIAASHPAAT